MNSHSQFTLCCGLTSSRSGGIILTASWRLMLPDSVSDMRKLCRRKYASERRMSFRVNCSCHASPSGYLQITQLLVFQLINQLWYYIQHSWSWIIRTVSRLQPGQFGVQYLAGIEDISLLQAPRMALEPTKHTRGWFPRDNAARTGSWPQHIFKWQHTEEYKNSYVHA